jgi:hypothetical protein
MSLEEPSDRATPWAPLTTSDRRQPQGWVERKAARKHQFS